MQNFGFTCFAFKFYSPKDTFRKQICLVLRSICVIKCHKHLLLPLKLQKIHSVFNKNLFNLHAILSTYHSVLFLSKNSVINKKHKTIHLKNQILKKLIRLIKLNFLSLSITPEFFNLQVNSASFLSDKITLQILNKKMPYEIKHKHCKNSIKKIANKLSLCKIIIVLKIKEKIKFYIKPNNLVKITFINF